MFDDAIDREFPITSGLHAAERSRFLAKVAIDDSDDGCWLWTASRKRAGYGQFSIGGSGGAMVLASRVALEMSTGQRIPDGMFALHRCDNPPCCRPRHLRVGSRSDNMRDMVDRGRGSRVFPMPGSKTEIVLASIVSDCNRTDLEVAESVGVAVKFVSVVRLKARRRGLLPAPRAHRKLTESQVAEIRSSPRRSADLARDLGVSPSAISLVRRGRNWKMLSDAYNEQLRAEAA